MAQARERDGAILSVLAYTDYSFMEAEKLIEFIEEFRESDTLTADHWCDNHRASRFECARQHPQQADEQTPAPLGAVRPAPVRNAKCTCGDAGCRNDWHRLAMWIKDNPREGIGLLKN